MKLAEPTTTPKAYTEETQEQNTRATRQKTRRNYKDDANGRPAAQERKKENPAKEKRTDANKTKILLLENTIKQMRLKAAAVDKTRIAETVAWKESIRQMQDREVRGEAARKLEKKENEHMNRELNKIAMERDDLMTRNTQLMKERAEIHKESQTQRKENEKLKLKINEMAESNKRSHKLEDEMANIRGKWEEEKRKNKETQSELTKIREEKSRMAAKLKEQKEEMNAMTELLTETANTTTPQQTTRQSEMANTSPATCQC